MTPRLLTLALAAAFALPAHADQANKSAPSPIANAGAATVVARPLLWKVSDADNDVYLLGSFHLLKSDDYPMPVEIDRAFDDAESLLFEVDPREMTSPETAAIMQKYMAYEDGQSLSKVLPKATLERLHTLVSASGGSVQALEQSEPWLVNLGLVLGVSQAMGLKADLGLDRHLMERAAKAGKPAGGLETIDAQMQAMDSVPYPEQAQGLDEFLVDPKKAVQQLQDMHAWWRAGDVERLDTGMRAEMAAKSPQSVVQAAGRGSQRSVAAADRETTGRLHLRRYPGGGRRLALARQRRPGREVEGEGLQGRAGVRWLRGCGHEIAIARGDPEMGSE